jgi:hypothetical protein
MHVCKRRLCEQPATLDIVRAIKTHDKRHRRFDLAEGCDQPLCDLVAAGDPGKDVHEYGLHRLVGEDQIDGLLDRFGVRAAAGVEEVCGRSAGLGDDIERRHDQTGPVAEDADVAVEFDVLQALVLRPALQRVFVLAIGKRLVIGVAVQRVAVE